MTWKRRIVIAQLGSIYGLLSLSGAFSSLEFVAFFGLALLLGAMVAWRIVDQVFRQAMILGFVTWYCAILVQALFSSSYLRNNPQYVDVVRRMPINGTVFLLLTGPLPAGIFALVAAVAAKLLASLRRRQPARD